MHKRQKCGDIGREVNDLGITVGGGKVVAKDPSKEKHQKTAGTRSKKTVVEAYRASDHGSGKVFDPGLNRIFVTFGSEVRLAQGDEGHQWDDDNEGVFEKSLIDEQGGSGSKMGARQGYGRTLGGNG